MGGISKQDAMYGSEKAQGTGKELSFNCQNLHMQNVYEGEFKHGLFNGFGRILDAQGRCHVGFWKTGPKDLKDLKSKNKLEVSRPHGKWCSYRKDGVPLNSEGLYIADAMANNNRLCALQKIKDFEKNTEPAPSFGQRVQDLFRGCGMCQPVRAEHENTMYIFETSDTAFAT